MLITKKIRLEVSEQDAATLEFMQAKCRGLYNWWVTRLRAGEKWPGRKEVKKTLQQSKEHDPELTQVYGKLLHEVYFRLDASMQAFLRRVRNGEKPGFPRVRPRHCFFTLIYPSTYLTVENQKLTLPTGGKGRRRNPHVRFWNGSRGSDPSADRNCCGGRFKSAANGDERASRAE